jgi:uncharacterized protein (UPF0276 family)
MKDRFGLGWRDELAAGILSSRDRIDVVEVIADDYFGATAPRARALRALAAEVPLLLHGVGMGLASCARVEDRRLAAMARLVEAVRPERWSEHLAFVRGGGREIGHLAAPPRCAATLEGTAANLERARRAVGTAPLVENVATLVDPPGSDRDESEWVAGVLAASGNGLLLDLHNLHANAVNFGFDPRAFLDRIPAGSVSLVHLAGGRWVAAGGGRRLLDDHLHDVPDPVYELLREAGRRFPQPLDVILERDGAYPGMPALLEQLVRARAALAAGRADAAAARAA